MQLFSTSFSMRAVALASIVLLGACSKKSDDPTPSATTTGMTWTADGTNYTSTTNNVAVQGTTVNLTGIATSTSGNNVISLAVPAAVGTYSIAGATGTANYIMSYNLTAGTTSTVYLASNLRGNGSGTVTVSSFSANEVIGTFTFTGDNVSGGTGTKAVTNGKFDIKY